MDGECAEVFESAMAKVVRSIAKDKKAEGGGMEGGCFFDEAD